MAGKITLRAVEAQKVGIIWDGDIPGFGLRVLANGARVYVLKFRAGGRGGRQRWLTIGRHGAPWTPASARDEVRRLLGLIASGIDPATQRDAANRNPSLSDFATRALDEQRGNLKPATAERYRYLLDRLILPELGPLRVSAISRADVTQLLGKLRAKPGQANLCLSVLRRLMTLAEESSERPAGTNPCRGIPKMELRKRERFLTSPELARLGEVLSARERDGSEPPFAIAGIRLLILTGARRSEIVTLCWRYVDFERRALVLPDSKTGAKPVYLSSSALDLLRKLPRVEGQDHVLPVRADRPVASLDKVWARVRVLAGLKAIISESRAVWNFHSLRALKACRVIMPGPAT